MIRDPYQIPSTLMRMRACGRRALLTRPETEAALTLEHVDDEALASLTRYRGLRALRLSWCELGPLAIAALRSLTSLRELWLNRCAVTGPGLEDAVASLPLRVLYLNRPVVQGLDVSSLLPRCEALEALTLDLGTETADGLFEALSAAPSLRWLYAIYASQVTDQTLPRLASLAALEDLWLHGCEGVTGATLDSLASARNLRGLRLTACDLGDASMHRLAALPSLRALDLGSCKGVSIAPLLPLRSLEVLRLEAAHPSSNEIEAIGELANLSHLDLGSCRELTDALLRGLGERLTIRGLSVASTGVRGEAFEDAARWSQLEELNANHAKIDDATMARLAKLPRLRRLAMAYCDVTAEGLARVTEIPSLVTLDVQGVKAVDDAAVDAWGRRDRWEELCVYGCKQVTGRSVVPLTRAHPGVVVIGEPHVLCDRSLAARECYEGRVTSVELSDGALAALVTPTTVMLVDRPSGTRRNKKSIPSNVGIVRLDPKGRALLTLSKKARLWDAANGAELPSLAFKLSRVDDAAFSADGSRLAVAGLGGSKKKPQRLVYLWDVATWSQLGTLEATHSDAPTSVALSPDGSHVVVAHASVEVLSVERAERVLCIERPSPFACFDAKGDAALFFDEGSVMRAPLDGAAVMSVTPWRALLERAAGVTALSERAEMAANPDHHVTRREYELRGLMVRGGEPVVLVEGSTYPGTTGLVVGSRAVWIQCDAIGALSIAITSDAKTLMVACPRERPAQLDRKVSAWALDDVMTMAEG